MTLSHILMIVRVRWRSALLVFMMVLTIVSAYTAFVTRKYTATSAVVLDVKSPDPIAGVVLPGMTVSGYMGTQVDVLKSERVLLSAVESLHLTDDPDAREAFMKDTQGQGDFEGWLAGIMLKSLDVKPSKDSNVITVSYTSRDTNKAAATANAIVKGYIETTLELRTEPAKQFNSLFDESTKTLRDALEQAQLRLSGFQREKGIVATDEKLDIENTRLADLSSQLVTLQGTANESAGRQSQAGQRSDQMPEVLNNQMVILLSADLARGEARLRQLSQTLGDQNPQVTDLAASNAELRQRVAVERARIAGSLGVNNNVNQGRLEQLRADVAAQRARVQLMKGMRDEAAVLQRDVDNAQRAYDSGFARLKQSTLESQTTQTNVSVIQVAKPSPFPSSPKVKLNVIVAILLGGALAIGTAILREQRDWRLRTDDDVVDALKMPLLGVVPHAPRIDPHAATGRTLGTIAARLLGRPATLTMS